MKELLIFKSSHFGDSLATLRDLTSPLLLSFVCACVHACFHLCSQVHMHIECVLAEARGWPWLSFSITPHLIQQGQVSVMNACIWLILSAILLLGFPVSALLWGGYGEATMPAWRFFFTWVSKICSSGLHGQHLCCFLSPTLCFLEGDLKLVGVRIERYCEDNGALVDFQLDLFRPF